MKILSEKPVFLIIIVFFFNTVFEKNCIENRLNDFVSRKIWKHKKSTRSNCHYQLLHRLYRTLNFEFACVALHGLHRTFEAMM
jgi:hypothetical protein